MDPDREPPQQPSPLSELTDEKLNAEVAELTGASGYLRNPRAQRRRPQDDRGRRSPPRPGPRHRSVERVTWVTRGIAGDWRPRWRERGDSVPQ